MNFQIQLFNTSYSESIKNDTIRDHISNGFQLAINWIMEFFHFYVLVVDKMKCSNNVHRANEMLKLFLLPLEVVLAWNECWNHHAFQLKCPKQTFHWENFFFSFSIEAHITRTFFCISSLFFILVAGKNKHMSKLKLNSSTIRMICSYWKVWNVCFFCYNEFILYWHISVGYYPINFSL